MYTTGAPSPAPAAMCMGGGLSIVLGLRELRLEGLAADERVLVGDAADDGLAPVPYQGIPDGDDFGGDGGRVDVVPDTIAPDVVQEPVRGARRRAVVAERVRVGLQVAVPLLEFGVDRVRQVVRLVAVWYYW